VYNRVNLEKLNDVAEYQKYNNLNAKPIFNQLPVHNDDWAQSMANNPNPKALYPYIIGSYDELHERVSLDLQSIQELENSIKIIDKKKAELAKSIEEDDAKIPIAKKSNKEILKKIALLYQLMKKIQSNKSQVDSMSKEDPSITGLFSRISNEVSSMSTLSHTIEDLEAQVSCQPVLRTQECHAEISENKALKAVYLINEYLEGVTKLTNIAEENEQTMEFITVGIKKIEEDMKKHYSNI
jgi:hypothetical protein